jgi:hypothetical protein
MLSVRSEQQNPTLLLAVLHREALLGHDPYRALYEGLAHPIDNAAERAAGVVAALEADRRPWPPADAPLDPDQ